MYNKYDLLKDNKGSLYQSPFIKLPVSPTDKYIEWSVGKSRLDLLSNMYYGSPEFGFLILYANPKYISEWEIPDNSILRIPFPLSKSKQDYESILKSLLIT